MPELPEVETIVRGLKPYLEKNTITDVHVRQSRLRWPIIQNLPNKLIGQRIEKIIRRAKYILFSLECGTLIFHLGMSGSLRIQRNLLPVQKHAHVDIIFANNLILRFVDPRRFGACLWTDASIADHFLLKNLGPEPFDRAFNARYLKEKAKNKLQPIKSFIMDSKVMVGVGNIYATEALFLAQIHPLKAAGSLTLDQFQKLLIAIRKILRASIKKGGTTLKDFIDHSGKPGYFKHALKVYGRANQLCYVCKHPLANLKVNQRSTVYCKCCQKLSTK